MALRKRASRSLVPAEIIERRILLVRGQKVLLDTHLAELYEVETRALLQAVKRNLGRFPLDFMFQLTAEEGENLRSQIVISSEDGLKGAAAHGGRRYLPYVFTEQGVAMLSSVLRTERAITVNIAIMRTFVRLRQILATHKQLAERLAQLEKKYDRQFKVVFDALRQLVAPPLQPPKRPIGFLPPSRSSRELAGTTRSGSTPRGADGRGEPRKRLGGSARPVLAAKEKAAKAAAGTLK